MKRFNGFFGLLFICMTIVSCEVINPEEDIPAYIHISKIDFRDSTTNQLAIPLAQKITDAWVYVDGRLQGVYELPATFPVTKQGAQKITVYGGVLDNGISSTRKQYVFFTEYEKNHVLTPGKIDTLVPEISYNNKLVNFSFNEDFESGSIFDTTINSKVAIKRVDRSGGDSLVFEGNYSAEISLKDSLNYFEAETQTSYVLPGQGAPVYLEMNYKNDVRIEIGLYAIKTNQVVLLPKIVLSPTQNKWNKIYIELTPEVSSVPGAKFKVYFKAIADPSKTVSNIYLDNIKLVY